jgi:hypothetical protein
MSLINPETHLMIKQTVSKESSHVCLPGTTDSSNLQLSAYYSMQQGTRAQEQNKPPLL